MLNMLMEPYGMGSWHLLLRPCGATSPDECRDASVHGQRPWLSVAGAKRVTFNQMFPILSILLIYLLSVPAHAQAPAHSALDAKGTPSSVTGVSGASTQFDLGSKNVPHLPTLERSN